MKNITINTGNILTNNFNVNYKCAVILDAINHIFQREPITHLDRFTDKDGVWCAVSYNQILNEIPILKISKAMCNKYVNDLISMGFIDRHWNCERLSRTYLKPSENFKVYFESGKSEITINQNECFYFDKKLSFLNWIVLKAVEKNAIGKFNYNYVEIDTQPLLNSLCCFFISVSTYYKNLEELTLAGYIEKKENPFSNKKYLYRAGFKLLEFKEMIK